MDRFNLMVLSMRLVIAAFFLILISCTTDEVEINFEDFVVNYANIKTDHSVNSISSDLFIWLDESNFLSLSSVSSAEEEKVGLYLVSLSGDVRQVVDGVVSDYCVLGKKILIQGHKGYPIITGHIPDYKLEVVSANQIRATEGKKYSSHRCGFVKFPDKQPAIFRSLKPEDGFLEITIDDENTQNLADLELSSSSNNNVNRDSFYSKKIRALYTQSQLKHIWDLYIYEPVSKERIKLPGRWPAPTNLVFEEYLNTYFAYHNFGKSASFWRLNLVNKSVDYEQFDYPPKFIDSGSLVFEPTRVGYILEHHNRKNGGLYLVVDGETIMLKEGVVRHASISPDGCRVAYSEGDIFRNKKDKQDFRQELRVADICSYMSERNKLNGNK